MTVRESDAALPCVVTICDADPVLRLAAIALRGAGTDDRAWINAYFSPERCSTEEVEAVGGAIRSRPIEVRALSSEQEGDLARLSAGSDVLICRRAQIGRDVLSASPRLRRIHRLGADSIGIDVAAVREAGIKLRCIERPTLALTAEHAILLMLAASKNLVEGDRRVRAADWDKERVKPVNGVAYNWPGLASVGGLYGRTIGLIGLGQVGLLVAERLKAFGAKILYSKRNRLSKEREAEFGVEYAHLPDLLSAADLVSLHAPWTAETEKMMGASAFSQMKRGAIFVNTSRGALVDEDALADALLSGEVGFAALDTHAAEPRPQGTRLGEAPNTIFSPHLAGGSRRELLKEVAQLIDAV